ncbi:mediator of RNA polymerase II transcription subunit 15-like isoform X2 [Hermetia illucens]|uniref:mediator of RNA polymerase II transcription subunit 15-like isoform X2 n=1 Tax=Hermetia illucens TaxID=343691 RepID=UPI0018CC2813|nr:mediator of RNA polymerase II transcription subunit 15-like isoform X2 [Hermetia illucens]
MILSVSINIESTISSGMASNQRTALQQSPKTPLRTPGQVTGSNSSNAQEHQLCQEKYKQLAKYIEPLKLLITHIQDDENTERVDTMMKLLTILCCRHPRVTLSTLLRCEQALARSSHPLIEALRTTLRNPDRNQILQRTFQPCVEDLFGTDIQCLPPVKPQRMEQEDNSFLEIPHVLQGEIARLDQKFTVSLDSVSQIAVSKRINLICRLNDKLLPCVPPIGVTIPEKYPTKSPILSIPKQEYSATPFLRAVQAAFAARARKSPEFHSLTHVLNNWEIAIRQACSPNSVAPNRVSTLLGI